MFKAFPKLLYPIVKALRSKTGSSALAFGREVRFALFL
jgi:hypothetical protein